MPSFIENYMKTVENSQPAREYHIWCALSALSVFAGRRFWFPFGPLHYYPILYVALVGDPGTGKSTAMNRVKNIVRLSGVCPVAATQITKQALTQKMSSTDGGQPKKVKFAGQKFYVYDGKTYEYNQYAIFASELVEFIQVDPKVFLDFLTSVWDEPVLEVETKHQGNDFINGPYITMLACITPEKMKGYLKQEILGSGFARRAALVHVNYKNIVHWPSYTDEQKQAEFDCVKFGQNLQLRCGPFEITDECKEFYEAWNIENERVMKDRPPTIRGWYESKGEMLFKIAMLIALSNEGGERRVIEVPYYKMALYYCSLMEKNLPRVFEGMGNNANAAAISQVCNMLEGMHYPMNRKIVLSMFMGQATSINELDDTITHMIAVGRLAKLDVINSAQLVGTLLGSPNSIASCKDLALTEQVALLRKGMFVQQTNGTESDSPSSPDPGTSNGH